MRRIVLILSSLSLLVLLLNGCAHRIPLGGTFVEKKGVVNISGLWLKDKAKKYDMSVRITNLSEKTILIPRNNLVCKKGPIRGAIHYTSIDHLYGFNWLLGPEESLEFYFICQLGAKTAGDYVLKLKKIFENKDPDTMKRGKVLATDLTLKIKL